MKNYIYEFQCHNSIGESLVTILFTPDMVRQKLKNFNPGKSPGHDKWHPHFLRELANDMHSVINLVQQIA